VKVAPAILTCPVLYLPAFWSSMPRMRSACILRMSCCLAGAFSWASFSMWLMASGWFLASRCSFRLFPLMVIPSWMTSWVSLSVRVLPSMALELYVNSICICSRSFSTS